MTLQKHDFCPEMLSALQNANSILLCTHISPDGDAIGSTLAMGLALQGLGKRVILACADPVPQQFRFLPGAENFVTAQGIPDTPFDAGLAIDAAGLGRIGACGDAYLRCPVTLQMDHHPTNPRYAQYNAVDGDAPAAGCVVRRMLRALGIDLTRDIARCLYCAISMDTGNFCFNSTSSEAFRIMAELVEAGLPLGEDARQLHLLREGPHVRLLGRALASLRFFGGGKCACMRLDQADYRAAGALPEHCDKIVNYALNIPGVEMAYLADGWEENATRMSLRALPPWDVSRIARTFGGGGHVLAAGCRCEMGLEEMCAAVEKEMLQLIGEKP